MCHVAAYWLQFKILCDYCSFSLSAKAFLPFDEFNRGILLDDSGDTGFVSTVFISSIKIGMYVTFCFMPPHVKL